MKVFLLADGQSAHTKKWVHALLQEGVEIFLFSLNSISEELKNELDKMNAEYFSPSISIESNQSVFKKLKYLKLIPKMKKCIKQYKPEVVHAHYASSYGLMALLSGFKPYLVSVWGSDIMVFPKKGAIAKKTIKKILRKASEVYVTSKYLDEVAKKELDFETSLQISFGIDANEFPLKTEYSKPGSLHFIIAKSLTETYGIDIAIEAFNQLMDEYPIVDLKLTILGDGPNRGSYEKLAGRNLNESIVFKGKVPHSEVVKYLSNSDVLVNCSRNESFGVSVLEASACGLAVIASERGGLKETVDNGNTGLLIDVNVEDCFNAMKSYVENEELVSKHGIAGRKFVEDNFDLKKQVKKQIEAYNRVIKKN